MLYILFAILIINLAVYRSYLNPVFIQSAVWLVYYIVLSNNIGAYDIYLKNINAFIVLQSIGFSLGGFICCLFTKTSCIYLRKPVAEHLKEKAYENVRLLYPVVLIVIVAAILFIVRESGSLSIFSIMNFRDSLSEDDGKKVGAIGTLQLLTSVYVIAYIGTIRKNSAKWYKHVLLIVLFLYFTLLLGSKGQFVYFFCATTYLLVWLKKINRFHLSLAFLSFLAILALLFFLRAGGDSNALNKDSVINLLLIYTVTALPALYLSQSAPPKIFGYYSFRVIYVWLNKVGFSLPIAPVLSDWVTTPLPTNVYSYIMPYYKDFGYIGIFILPLTLGYIVNFIYFKANRGSFTFLLLNSLLIYAIITQVWEENYFRQISNWAYISIVVFILCKTRLTGRRERMIKTAIF